MKYLIRINRKSIKENPNAGSTTSYYSAGQDIELRFTIIIDKNNLKILKNNLLNSNIGEILELIFQIRELKLKDKIYKIIKRENDNNKLLFYVFNNKNFILKSMGATNHIKSPIIDIDNKTQVVHSIFPESEWLYKYKKTKIKCSECGKKFFHNKLEADYNDAPINNICPYCKEPDCCDIEYEDINKIIKEES